MLVVEDRMLLVYVKYLNSDISSTVSKWEIAKVKCTLSLFHTQGQNKTIELHLSNTLV